jgi:hypothetical protein
VLDFDVDDSVLEPVIRLANMIFNGIPCPVPIDGDILRPGEMTHRTILETSPRNPLILLWFQTLDTAQQGRRPSVEHD